MTYRVLIVDDHSLLRRGLRSIIASLPDFEVVGEAAEGRDAIRQSVSMQPHLILMDIAMPGMNGIEATSQIKRRTPGTRVLMVTEYDSEDYVREAFRAGADGYALKDTPLDEFVRAVNTVATGKKFISPEISMHLVDTYFSGGIKPSRTVTLNTLTSRERSILQLIAEGRTNRMTGEFLNISAKTVEKHRASLMRKLGLQNSVELILAALDMGLIQNRSRQPPVAILPPVATPANGSMLKGAARCLQQN